MNTLSDLMTAIKKLADSWDCEPSEQDATWNESLVDLSQAMWSLKILPVREFNAYTILRQKRLVLTKAALEELRKGPPAAESAPAK